ncbi:MAG: ABC transporter permease [Desulfitobacteriaceae bacterium]
MKKTSFLTWRNLPGWSKVVLSFAILISLWQLATSILKIPPYLLPSPAIISRTLINQRGVLLSQLEPTLLEAISGFILGNTAATLLAMWFVKSSTAERALLPLAIALRSLPIVAITPVITLSLGHGYATTIFIVGLVTFFPTLVNTSKGLRSVSKDAEEFLSVLAASEGQSFRLLKIPSALPYIFSAMRVTGPGSILGALVAEWVASDRGLGFLILDSQSRWQISLMWAAIIVATLLAVASFGLVGLAERHLLSWHESMNAGE